jgi:hypothetical protein
LNDFLERAIISKLLNAEDEEKLVCNDGPLATFARKIQLGYAMGLYETELRDDLTRIKDIRNDFAHSVIPICFNTQSVRDRCLTLQGDPEGDSLIFRWGLDHGLVDIVVLYDTPDPDKAARDRFIAACHRLSEHLNSVAANPGSVDAVPCPNSK